MSSVFISSFVEKKSEHSFLRNLPSMPMHIALEVLQHCHVLKFVRLGNSDCFFPYTLGRSAFSFLFCQLVATELQNVFEI